MRTKQPKPKKLTQVDVPTNLRVFLEEVAHLIEIHDEAAFIESDDLLQTECAFGGLIEDGTDEYGFTYFLRKGLRPKWELLLSASQIRDVADGTITKLELWACSDENCGSMFSWADELCSRCDYVDDEEKRALPQGEFSSRRDWALAYFAIHPDAHPFQVIIDYNGRTELGERLGYFSLEEVREIQSGFQS